MTVGGVAAELPPLLLQSCQPWCRLCFLQHASSRLFKAAAIVSCNRAVLVAIASCVTACCPLLNDSIISVHMCVHVLVSTPSWLYFFESFFSLPCCNASSQCVVGWETVPPFKCGTASWFCCLRHKGSTEIAQSVMIALLHSPTTSLVVLGWRCRTCDAAGVAEHVTQPARCSCWHAPHHPAAFQVALTC